MGNLRKVIASISLVAILSTFAVTNAAFASGAFTDSGTGWFATELHNGKAWDVLAKETGVFTNTTAMPDKDIIRADSAKVIYVGAGLTDGEALKAGVFTDVTTQDFAKYVKAGLSAGVFTEKSKFDPTGLTNRAQAAAMIVRAFGLPAAAPATKVFSDVNISYTGGEAWMNNVSTAYCYGLAKGVDGKFLPSKNVSRAEFAKMVIVASEAPALLAACAAAPDSNEPPVVTPPVDEVTGGDLVISLSADNPSAETVPASATSVAFAAWDFEAGDTGAVVKSLSVHKFGVVNLAAANSCYLYEDNDRLTSGTSVNSSTNTASFNSFNFSVPANTTRTVWLKCDVGATATSGEGGFELLNATAVNAGDSEVTGDFPIKGEKFGFSTTAVGGVTLTSNGSVAAPKVGEDGVTIAKFKMDVVTEAANLDKIGLYLGGGNISVADIQNLELYVSGTTDPIATVEGVNSKDVALFVLDKALKIEKGDNKTFQVKADLNPGRSGDTILAYIDETTDVVAIGDTYGFGMAVTLAGATGYDGGTCTSASPLDCTFSTVEGGDITITSSGPAATSVGINGKDVVLQKFTIATAGDVTFKNFPISLDTSADTNDATEGLLNSTAANLTDIKISCGDANETVWGPIDSTSLTTTIGGTTAIAEATTGDTIESFYLFTNEKTFEAGGDVSCQLTADVANTSTLTDMTVVASLELDSTYPEIRDTNNKIVTNSTALVPSANIVGKTMTIASPSLTLSLAATPIAGQTEYVKGQKKVKFVGVSAVCGSSSDCKVKDVTLTGDIDETGGQTFLAGIDTNSTPDVNLNSVVGSVWLEDSAGAVVAAAKPVQTTGLVNFTNLSWTIKAGETSLFYVVGDISSNGFVNSNEDEVSFGINTASDVKFEDSAGTSRDATNTVNATNAVYVSVIGGGSLTISGLTGTSENILVAGAADQTVSKFKFETTKEAFKVTDLSVNAKQYVSASNGAESVAAADLGEADNNIANVKISYVNSAGLTETKTGSVTSGTVQFSGMDMYIGKDESATLTVTASTNEIIEGGGGATAGEYIELNLAFNNFDSIAQSSGESYKAGKLDAVDVAASSDLDYGSSTFTTAVITVPDQDAGTAGNQSATPVASSSLTLIVTDMGMSLPIGTLIKSGADSATYTGATEPLLILTSVYTSGDLTLTGIVANAADDTVAFGDTLYYSLPSASFTNTNRMYVYKTLPVLAQSAAGALMGAKTLSPTDTIFDFTITPNAKDDVIIRQGLAGDDENDVNDVAGAIADGEATITTTSGDFIDGAGGVQIIETTGGAVDGIFLLDETYTGTDAINNNDYVSFWMKINEVDNDSDVDFADISLVLDDDTTPDAGTTVSLGSTTLAWANGIQVASGQEFDDDTWVLFTVSISAAAVTADDQIGFAIVETTEIDASDVILVDGVVLHNEILYVDLAANQVLDTTPSSIVDCTLKKGSDVIADSAVAVQTTSQGRLFIVPQDNISGTDYGDISVTKGVANTYSLVCDSSAMITQSVNPDNLTPSIDFGSSVDGTVTRGDFWWSADETTRTIVYWLGNVGTKLSGNTLTY